MFGVFGTLKKPKEVSSGYASKCVHFHRELAYGGAAIFVEVHSANDHVIYVSNSGVTPSYLNKPYDDWCRESLTESYVFASIDSAVSYFKNRRNGLSQQLMEAISSQIRQ